MSVPIRLPDAASIEILLQGLALATAEGRAAPQPASMSVCGKSAPLNISG